MGKNVSAFSLRVEAVRTELGCGLEFSTLGQEPQLSAKLLKGVKLYPLRRPNVWLLSSVFVVTPSSSVPVGDIQSQSTLVPGMCLG